ncbi:MAG: hypothetical protein HN833_03030 [Elusimicrobiaceae bacterium]|nr:hypothetical protein [Elusimicrobiaceae bacterium]MBT3955429.1 hypothetical protein [Elusimicrobiaceae bacterium]MBT4008769.1 hypothetical protein [Elusimicrobiaceae bacterium]MBT4402293.1 hypothetical protein [Elusimicrobiaceae bacterium]MBT4440101.1 hypothetical protein [Elusimicrobiaceae bacterium]
MNKILIFITCLMFAFINIDANTHLDSMINKKINQAEEVVFEPYLSTPIKPVTNGVGQIFKAVTKAFKKNMMYSKLRTDIPYEKFQKITKISIKTTTIKRISYDDALVYALMAEIKNLDKPVPKYINIEEIGPRIHDIFDKLGSDIIKTPDDIENLRYLIKGYEEYDTAKYVFGEYPDYDLAKITNKVKELLNENGNSEKILSKVKNDDKTTEILENGIKRIKIKNPKSNLLEEELFYDGELLVGRATFKYDNGIISESIFYYNGTAKFYYNNPLNIICTYKDGKMVTRVLDYKDENGLKLVEIYDEYEKIIKTLLRKPTQVEIEIAN